jgi:hypothetical protein
VVERIGPVAYRLRLPDNARIHGVFHVGVLKPFRGTPPATTLALPPLHNGRLLHRPAHALRARLRRGEWHVLIHWTDMAETKVTWEPVDAFKALFPNFQLADELYIPRGGERCYGGERLPSVRQD